MAPATLFTGKTLEDAVKKGLEALGIGRAEAMITVIEEGSGGFLGLGARPYRVRIMPRPGGPIREPDEGREGRRTREREGRGPRRERGARAERGERGARVEGGRGSRPGRPRDAERAPMAAGENREREDRRPETRGERSETRGERPGSRGDERRGPERFADRGAERRGEGRTPDRRMGDRRRQEGGPRFDDRRGEGPRHDDAARPGAQARPDDARRAPVNAAPAGGSGAFPAAEGEGEPRRRRRGRRGGRGRGGAGRAFAPAEAGAEGAGVERAPMFAPEAEAPRSSESDAEFSITSPIDSPATYTPAAPPPSAPMESAPSPAEFAPSAHEAFERRPFRDAPRRHESGGRGGSGSPPLSSDALAAEGRRCTEELLTTMGFQAKVTATASEDRVDVVAEVGADDEMLNGTKGEVRQALQHLLNRMVNRGEGSRYHLQLEINDFWKRREEELQELARQLADRAIANQVETLTEYLNAQERRIIHVALREDTRVKTYALGDGMIKRLAVAPADFPEGPGAE